MQTTDTGRTILIDLTDDTDLFDAFRRCLTTLDDGRRHSAAIEGFASELNARASSIMGDAFRCGGPAMDLHTDGDLWNAFQSACRTYRAFRVTGDDAEHSARCDAFDALLQMRAHSLAAQRRSLVA